MDLCLDIHGNSIESSLSKFTKPEILDKDNKYKCPRCVKLVKAQKQLTIFNPPNILTIQLKRFNYSFFGKIDKPIAFPETLNLSPYISDESVCYYLIVFNSNLINRITRKKEVPINYMQY